MDLGFSDAGESLSHMLSCLNEGKSVGKEMNTRELDALNKEIGPIN